MVGPPLLYSHSIIPGTVVEGLIPEGDEPALSKLSDLEMLVMTSGGHERTAEEFRELFAAAGLRLTRVLPTAGAAFVLEGFI